MSTNSLTTARPPPVHDTSSAAESAPVQKWLDACSGRVRACSSLLVAKKGESLERLASMPAADRPPRPLVQAALRALRDKQVFVESHDHDVGGNSSSTEASQRAVIVGFALRVGGRPAAIVFQLWVDRQESSADILRRLSSTVLRRAEDQTSQASGSAPIAAVPKTSTPEQSAAHPAEKSLEDPLPNARALVAEQGALLAALTAIVDESDLEQALHSLSTSIAQRFNCSRVSIGCRLGRKIVLRAVSGTVGFDPRSALMVDIVEAMNETRALASTITLPDISDDAFAPPCHATLAEQLRNPSLISLPLVSNDSVIGVLLLERDRAFTPGEATQLERVALLLSPVLDLKITDAQSGMQSLRRVFWRALRSLFGTKYAGSKFLLLCVAIAVGLSATQTKMFRLDASAAIEARTQRAVVSSFPSFLRQVEVRSGDIVQRGDVLAQLDVEELQLERIKLEGEKDKLVKEYRATLAQRDRSKVRVLEARRSQAQAKLDLLDAQISRATLRAPIDGAVISADLLQSLGRPVERGELLFEVASLEDYRLILKLDEKDIGWVEPGARGEVRLRSLADRTFNFEVASIAPVSEPGQGVNVFRIEAKLENLPPNLKPGMEGVAKIEVKERAIGWIWTRSFADWLRMQVWMRGGV